MECDIIDCPKREVISGECELSLLDKKNDWYTEPGKCTHYKWRKSNENSNK
jgi:hypothetical protein